MKKSKRIALAWIAFAVPFFIVACRAEGDLPRPAQITAQLKSEGVYKTLTTWVDNYIDNKRMSHGDMEIEVGTEQHPMCYLSKDKFDWKIIGINTLPAGEIRITCDANGEWNVVHLGFLRYGIIVNIKMEPLALKGAEIVYQDNRVAVFSEPERTVK
ncbi:MAG: hypothetical protein K9M98_15430 [Cephaloticoccus sp.]|nr:hypothetical protein [Cephaloticoccus sp.]MCF7761892.1 hypothetical protein [Cephaloticoccus sp.]